jgi:hypothetical protein
MDIALITIWIAVSLAAILLGLALEHRHITGWGWLTAAGGLALLIASIHWIPALTPKQFGAATVKSEITGQSAAMRAEESAGWDLRSKLKDTESRLVSVETALQAANEGGATLKEGQQELEKQLAAAKEAQQELEKELAAAKEASAAPQPSAAAPQPAPEAEAELQATKQRCSALEDANQQLTKECSAAKDAENAAQAQLKAEAERYAALNADYERLRTDEAAAKANVRDIEAKLAEAKNVKPVIVRVPEPKDLHKDMDASLFAEHYDVRPLPGNELISGKRGSYYVVNLRNAESGNRFIFPGGEFTLGADEAQLKQALSHFASEVVTKLQADHKTVEIFVRGRADKSPMNGRPAVGDPSYRRIKVLHLVGPDRYADAPTEKTTGTPVDNRDLPDLRAAYLGKLVNTAIPAANSVILDGAIADDANEYERTASIILWVPW